MDNREKGILGEDVASKFVERNGFRLLTRNYRKKWGEIDIIAMKDDGLHFFEVKSVTDKRRRPEENVHSFKMKQIRKMVQTYLAETGRGTESQFHFHVLCVFMDMEKRRASVKWIKNVIL